MSWYYGDSFGVDMPPWDGTGIPIPLASSGWPGPIDPPDGLWLYVPQSQTITVDDPTIYETRLRNFGAEVDEAETRLVFAWADGTPMVEDDIEYATEDDGTPTILPLTVDGDTLVAVTSPYPIPAGLNATGRVRITIYKPGTVEATSTITDTSDDSVLAESDYEYVAVETLTDESEATDGSSEPEDGEAPTGTPGEGESTPDEAPDAPAGGDESEAEQQPAEDEGYDPGDHTVVEVQAYLDEHPDQTEYVLDRERAGKARTTLIGA